MFEISPRGKMVERAILIGAYTHPTPEEEAQDLLEELGDLVNTLGIPIIDRILVHHRESHARYLIGTGKAEEIQLRAKEYQADALVFDNALTPAQQRNWEKLCGILVIDRQEVILDIFGARAQTREARIQVDLARMSYSLPRLTRAWSHLGQQGGGIGGKGEGETQLEQDRRKIRGQMDRLRRDLEEVRSNRANQRKNRQRTPVPNAAIVGYTNAGKSSLLRRLTGADVLIEDKLFATLDTTTRKIALPNKRPLVLTDTVGFIRKLPHALVDAFHATLEEATFADFLIHVIDASHPRCLEFYETTMQVLDELGADTKQMVLVFNKIDKLTDPSTQTILRSRFPDALFISTHTGKGMDALIEKLSELTEQESGEIHLRLPPERSDLLARIHREGTVHHITYEGNDTLVHATTSPRLRQTLQPFVYVA